MSVLVVGHTKHLINYEPGGQDIPYGRHADGSTSPGPVIPLDDPPQLSVTTIHPGLDP
ncbi:hypothetical protein WOLCODRAFT_23227 [Wolfiporia cocos MD-104 SS10]|uniref:Uncharacterized protein n=1 Tax=Wolfiporia cocos (strain MD-104) TaxID=742152 RepID=A0A2H3J7R6_WOLCO|nr:hypothetical protein WOLCODRAFT_23227 [Wolfiporia cocos MD-104 SS10]